MAFNNFIFIFSSLFSSFTRKFAIIFEAINNAYNILSFFLYRVIFRSICAYANQSKILLEGNCLTRYRIDFIVR